MIFEEFSCGSSVNGVILLVIDKKSTTVFMLLCFYILGFLGFLHSQEDFDKFIGDQWKQG